jgi:hypothetical protein
MPPDAPVTSTPLPESPVSTRASVCSLRGRAGWFLVVAAVVICTPGQDTALTIRNALAGGRRSGLATALGVALRPGRLDVRRRGRARRGAAGVAAAFTALRLAGAAYLVYLGLQSLLAAARRVAPGTRRRRARATPGGSLRQGLSATSRIRRWPSSSRACCHSSEPRCPLCSGSDCSSRCSRRLARRLRVAAARARGLLQRSVSADARRGHGHGLVALGLRVAAVRG